MYGFVLVPDCTIHFINVFNTERGIFHCQAGDI